MRRHQKLQVELSPIKQVELQAARLPHVVSLAQGIPSFDTPEPIKAYVKAKLDEGIVGKYSLAPGLIELRELVAEHLRAEGMRYDADGEILVTAGAIEAIAATLLALTEPGAEVLLPSPCYASYQQVIRMAGCHPRFVPLDEERNFDLDVDAIARRITPRTRALFYCNPNNPSGTIYSRQQSIAMLELAERHDLLVITDEVYKDFLYSDDPYFTPALLPEFRHRVVRIFSFSKAYAMTGWRVGYLHSSRELVTEILKVHDGLVTCAPVISQHAAVGALLGGDRVIAAFREAYRRRRDITLRHLDDLSHVFDYQKPAGAYFVFPRVKDTVPLCADSQRLAADLLQQARVALVPGIAFGPTGESHLRISFSRDDAEIEEAFSRLKRYFQQAAVTSSHTSAQPPRLAVGEAGAIERRQGRAREMARRIGAGYLQQLARIYLRRQHPTVIAIAGFRGKTVLKRIIGGLLQRHAPTRVNPRSYNTEVGLPLAVLGLEIDPRNPAAVAETLASAASRALLDRQPVAYMVLELGTRRRGDMSVLLRTVQPDWAVVTSIADQAQERGDPLDVIRAEIARLLQAVPGERLLYCADDPVLEDLLAEHGVNGTPLRRDRLEPIEKRGAAGATFRFSSERGCYELGPEIVGDSAVYALQAAILLGEQLGLADSTLRAFIAEETWPGGAGPASPRERR